MKKIGEHGINIFFIVGMILAWTAYYLASNFGVDITGSPYITGLLLRSSAFIVLTIFIIAKRKFLSLFKYGKLTLVLLAIGVLGFLLDAFANVGFKHGSISNGTILLKTDILMANLASVIFLKEKLKWTDWAATAIMIVGVVLILGINFKNLEFNWYDLFFIASALCVTINAFVIKSVQKKLTIESDVIAYYNNFIVWVLFMISSLIAGDFYKFTSIDLNMKFWLIMIGGGIAQSLIYIFYYRNLKYHQIWKIKLYLLLVPVLSCIIGVVALDEDFGFKKGIGILLVLIGAILIVLRDKFFKTKVIKNETDGGNYENY